MDHNKEQAKTHLKKILEKYNKYKNSDALEVEANAEKIIENIFEEVLGWESLVDYIKRKAQRNQKYPDYTFRFKGINKFYVEAKKISANLNDIKFQKQAIGYARSSAVSFAVLTNFVEIRVYAVDGDVDTVKDFDKVQLFKPIKIENCLNELEFEKLWLLSKDSFKNKYIDNFAEENCKLKKRKEIGKQLSEKLNKLRIKIENNICKNDKENKEILLKEDKKSNLEEATQKILNRLVFVRFCEDREYENRILEMLLNSYHENNHLKLWESIKELFKDYNIKNEKTGVGGYNSELFRRSLCDQIFIDDAIIASVIKELHFFDDGAPIDFSKIPADVLGNLYEEYLKYISRSEKTQETHRKKQGIYYTPSYIVDYIISNSLGELLKNKRVDADKIRILDPACGSGSFLIKSFDVLKDYHNLKDKHYMQRTLADDGSTYSVKERILKNNIFGVDLDKQAIEIAQLNLLLKIAKKGHRLPMLQENIKIGNSLIDDPSIAGNKKFKWEEEFNNIIKEGGFDIIIGNPPWGAKISDEEKNYFFNTYKSTKREIETQLLFLEKALILIKESGYIGFIIPNTWMYLFSTEVLRKKILEECKIISIIELTKNIFADAPDIVPVIIILQKNKSDIQRNQNILRTISFSDRTHITQQDILTAQYNKVYQKDILKTNSYIFNLNLTPEVSDLLIKIRKNTNRLSEIAKTNYGIKTGDNEKYLASSRKSSNFKKCLKSKETSRYSLIWNNLWIDYGTHLAGYKKENIEIPKIIVQYIRKLSMKRRLICAFDERGEYYPLNNYSYITLDEKRIKYLLAILNSKLMNFYFANTFIDYNIKPTYLDLLPIKVVNNYEILTNKVDKMLELIKNLTIHKNQHSDEKNRLEKEIDKLDQEIDEYIFNLYGITAKEKKIISF